MTDSGKVDAMDYKFRISTASVDETRKLAIHIGKCLEKKTVFALKGDLGSGKTAFVQGLARGLDVPETLYITSPTFTLINEYPGRHPLFHIDLYRTEGAADLEGLGLEDIFDGEGVVAIEWAERLPDDFVPEYVAVQIDITGDESRNITIIPYGRGMENLIQTLDIFRKG